MKAETTKSIKRKDMRKSIISVALAFLVTLALIIPTGVMAKDATDIEWYNFRNNQENNGITSSQTPTDSELLWLKWGVKYGTGWAAAPTPPLILDGKIYIAQGKTIKELDKETGELIRTSEEMVGSCGYAMNPILYADGKLFVQLGNGIVQAVDYDTLKPVWYTAKIGGQTLCPISYQKIGSKGYIYTGTWNGESKDGRYMCFSTDDSNVTDGVKKAEWQFVPSGDGVAGTAGITYDQTLYDTLTDTDNVAHRGFYWAGAYTSENYIAVGSDDGTREGDYSANAVFYTLNPKTGEVIDRIDGIKGDIRTTTVYDDGHLYFCTKGGIVCRVDVDSDGHLSNFTSLQLKDGNTNRMITSSPVVYKGKIYIGASGSGGQFDADGGHAFVVIDNTKDELSEMYKISIPGYPQAAPLLSTAYKDKDFDNDGTADGRIYLYFTYNSTPGGIYYIYDTPDATSALTSGEELFVPESSMQQYCISTICTDKEGTLYYKNDSCYLMAVEENIAYIKDIKITSKKGSDISWNQKFSSKKSNYEVIVGGDDNSVTMKITAVEGATLKINGKTITDTTEIMLTADEAVKNEIVVEKGGDKRTYNISVRKQADIATLSDISVNDSNAFSNSIGLTKEFASETLSYDADITEKSKSFYNIWPLATDTNSKVQVFAESNVDGKEKGDEIAVTATNKNRDRYAIYPEDATKSTAVKIKVTSENGKVTKEYTVRLLKKVKADKIETIDIPASTDKDKTIKIEAKTTEQNVDSTNMQVTFSDDVVAKLKNAAESDGDITLELKTTVATFNVNNEALKTLTKENGELVIYIEKKEAEDNNSNSIYEITAKVNGVDVFTEDKATNGGKIEISVDSKEPQKGYEYVVYYLNGSEKTAMPTTYKDGKLSWSTNHFSTFEVNEISKNNDNSKNNSSNTEKKTTTTKKIVKKRLGTDGSNIATGDKQQVNDNIALLLLSVAGIMTVIYDFRKQKR